ncbi:MAG: glycosyltransferase [Candidatus Cloacimonetes bacterium]|jgi:glycosyltransferase involved in cell wall biosynthesis|nr:glycosyltransferase [Candidatus Cloacimonadota bacterium]MCK9336077.1 glycosyltransferase [Candidatus Cloacimonadota bacterium]MDD2684103.1 glycosyltransferase [Candidatus Cloacimonadota bacterium]MDD3098188.1 glycosyltransferase [Candidatus Cloacimonadota bacterium]MDD4668201.1 glycosyltransferase [Candidatus Cloacimonadota bacterium]
MNILYISYFYPPLGGPAALRNLKTVRYLSQAGASIHLLTVDDIEYAYYDESLNDLRAESSITRTPSLDPMALLKRIMKGKKAQSQAIYKQSPERLKLFIRRLYPIDDKIGWLPYLLRAGRSILSGGGIELIYVSCGPFSSAIGAYKLANEYALPLVVDYRDYWTLLSDYDLMGSRLKRAYSVAWEKRILKRANLIVTATKGIAEALADSFGSFLAERSFVLYNGHDEADFHALPSVHPSPEEYSLCYFGNIYARRSLEYLYQAILELEREMLTPSNLKIRLYGNFNREVHEEALHSGIKERIELLPQLSHHDALLNMQKSDALILVINSSSPKGTLTSKVFEYLRIGRPILALVPHHGEAATLLKECGQNLICPMESVSAIKASLLQLFSLEHSETRVSPRIHHYERGTQVKALHQRLEMMLSDKL